MSNFAKAFNVEGVGQVVAFINNSDSRAITWSIRRPGLGTCSMSIPMSIHFPEGGRDRDATFARIKQCDAVAAAREILNAMKGMTE